MKKLILSFIFACICMFSVSSCVTPLEADVEISYQDEYYIGSIGYPVYWIDNIAYYWYDRHWILVPRYRYNYIYNIGYPMHFRAHRPNPYNYYYRRPHHDGPRFGNHNQHPPRDGHRPNGNTRPNHDNHRPNGHVGDRPHTPRQQQPSMNGSQNRNQGFGNRPSIPSRPSGGSYGNRPSSSPSHSGSSPRSNGGSRGGFGGRR